MSLKPRVAIDKLYTEDVGLLPEWARPLLDAHNTSAEGVTGLQQAQRVAERRELRFTTAAVSVNTFSPPLKVALPFSPSDVRVARVVNNTAPLAVQTAAPHIDFTRWTGGILVRNIVGLEPLSSYTITIEALP